MRKSWIISTIDCIVYIIIFLYASSLSAQVTTPSLQGKSGGEALSLALDRINKQQKEWTITFLADDLEGLNASTALQPTGGDVPKNVERLTKGLPVKISVKQDTKVIYIRREHESPIVQDAHGKVLPSKAVTMLHEVDVTAASARRNLSEPMPGRMTMSGQDIESIPTLLGEPDVIKALQLQPGVSQGIEGFAGLYVHGGENDQNQYLYHGLPLYHINHLGGLFSSFNVATIQQADFYKTSFPARYGGSVSSVTDIAAKQPNFEKLEGQASLGLISGSAYISAPLVKDRTAVAVGIRRSWIDALSVPMLAIYNRVTRNNGEKIMAHYALSDVNLRLDHRFSENATAYVIGYWGADRLRFGKREFTRDGDAVEFYKENSNSLRWGNWGALLGANCAAGKGLVNVSAYYTSYFSNYSQALDYHHDLSDPLTEGYNRSKTGNGIRDIGVKATYDISAGDIYTLRAGLGYTHHHYNPENLLNESLSEGVTYTHDNKSEALGAEEVVAYVDNTVSPLKWLSMNVGLRGVSYNISGKHFNRLEPRAALRVKFADKVSLKASYSRMNQFVQQVSNNYVSLPTDLWQPTAAHFGPLTSDHYTAGIYSNLPAKIHFSAEAWYRNMDGVVEYRYGVSSLNPDIAWYDKLTSGRGWAYGLDFSLTKSVGRLTGTVGYGLMWNWREFSELNGGRRYPAKFDNRHKINVNLSYSFSDRVDMHVGWTFQTGNRMSLSLYNIDQPGSLFPDAPSASFHENYEEDYTGLNYIGERNNVRLPAYHRLDIGLNIHCCYKNGRRGTWNVSLYNAYCHWNPLTISKSWGADTNVVYYGLNSPYSIKHRFKTLAILPVIPSVSYTYHF